MTVQKEAVLTWITRIDSINHLLTFLQIRNDGKKDSSVCKWPGLQPLLSSTTTGDKRLVYTYSKDGEALNSQTFDGSGKLTHDTTYNISFPGFDSYLADLIIGKLPLKAGFTGKFLTITTNGTIVPINVTQVSTDILTDSYGAFRPAYLLNVDYNGYKVLYWVGQSNGEMLKFIVEQPDGKIFMKTQL